MQFSDIKLGQTIQTTTTKHVGNVATIIINEGEVTYLDDYKLRIGSYVFVYRQDDVEIQLVKDVSLEKGWYLYQKKDSEEYEGSFYSHGDGFVSSRVNSPKYTLVEYVGNVGLLKVHDG